VRVEKSRFGTTPAAEVVDRFLLECDGVAAELMSYGAMPSHSSRKRSTTSPSGVVPKRDFSTRTMINLASSVLELKALLRSDPRSQLLTGANGSEPSHLGLRKLQEDG
jgi:hypothetical protein